MMKIKIIKKKPKKKVAVKSDNWEKYYPWRPWDFTSDKDDDAWYVAWIKSKWSTG